jgi:hypothetical protein
MDNGSWATQPEQLQPTQVQPKQVLPAQVLPAQALPIEVLPTTPFLNTLLDDVMPALTDSAWRIVCVIVRQSSGWKDGKGGRKTSDWLTQRQLIAKTGRSSEALSRALDVLVRRDIIEVRTASGRLLETALQRRQARGRIYYAIHPRFLSAHAPKSGSPKMRIQKRIQGNKQHETWVFALSRTESQKRIPHARKREWDKRKHKRN